MAAEDDQIEYFVAIDTKQALVAEKQIDKATKEIEKDFSAVDTQVKKTSRAVNAGMKQMASETERSGRRMQNSAQKTGDRLKVLRRRVGNVGFQVQDIAVQMQQGTDAMIIFGQQGSQLAGAFGAGGAVVGAIIAVSAALGTAFLPALFNSTKATEELIDKLKDLIETSTLSEAQAAVLVKAEEDSIKSKQKMIDKIDEELKANRKQLEMVPEMFRAGQMSRNGDEKRLELTEKLTSQINQQTAQQELLRKEIEDSQDNIKTYNALIGEEGTTATVKQTEAVKTLVTQVTNQAEALGMTNRAIALMIAAQNQASVADIAAINAAFDKIEAYEAEEKAVKDLALQEKLAAQQRENLAKAAKTLGLSDELRIQQKLNDDLLLLDVLYKEGLLLNEEDYLKRRNELVKEANDQLSSLNDSVKGIDWDSFENRAVGALTSVVLGAQSGEDALRALALSIIQEVVGSLIKLGAQYLINATLGKTASAGLAAAGVAEGAALTAAFTPAAVAASIATAGGAAAAGLAGITTAAPAAAAAIAATSTIGSVGGGRLYGGSVSKGTLYPITEDGKSEILREGNKQYLLPGANGEVISNKDAMGMGETINNYNVNLSVPYNSKEQFRRDLQDSVDEVFGIVQRAQNDRGRVF